MGSVRLLSLIGVIGLGPACLSEWVAKEDSATGTADSATHSETGEDTACDEPEGDPGQVYEATDARITATAGSIDYHATEGHYFSTECATNLTATQPISNATTRQLTIGLEGSLDFAGSYNVLSLTIHESVGQRGNNFEYDAVELSGVTLDVTGFGPNGTAHGALSGWVTLSDTLSGESVDLTSLVIEAWPSF